MMQSRIPRFAVPPGVELLVVTVLVWLALAGMPWERGQLGISWDALNHQIYLGWTAEASRFGLDVLPAAYQTYQYPYLYWPLYKLAVSGFTGPQAAVVLATLHMACVPPLWLVARMCIPEASWFGAWMRLLAVALAFTSGLIVSLFHSTSNDLLAAIPLLWAFAMSLGNVTRAPAVPSTSSVVISGLLGGLSIAFKLSNGPLALLLPLLWMLAPGTVTARCRQTIWGCVAILAGFGIAYAPWGWQLWELHGNPIYPFADGWAAQLRPWFGRAP